MPIPTLAEALEEYIRWIKPYIDSPQEFENHLKLVQNLLKSGHILHKRLESL